MIRSLWQRLMGLDSPLYARALALWVGLGNLLRRR